MTNAPSIKNWHFSPTRYQQR